ncbi:hypothetical protein [Pseudoroseomonas cervicalis]|uniref:hypothetical protein n=1 Tax=Teichococcus cervicalis TaxID=204525 RepID=UPI0022F19C85|nr:hypothetical protein [Pseudoroseomonas cervicalis]WBV44165.1 hypothetical protein PFY06_06270 [Pseudoroseomonas cervicalis]
MARGRSRPPQKPRRQPGPAATARIAPAPGRPAPVTAGEAEQGVSALRVELDRMKRERDEARALLAELLAKQGGEGGAVVARRLTSLEEERQVARGQAVEAALARSRAEAALKALNDALDKAPGLEGWLLRRARRRILPR